MNAQTTLGPRCDLRVDQLRPHLNNAVADRKRCPGPATHRYRSPEMVDGYWRHRCEEHAALLDRSVCTVEQLAGAL